VLSVLDWRARRETRRALTVNHRHVTTADHLMGSRSRARLLRILVFPDGERVWVRELCRRVGTGISSVRRELSWLRDMGLVEMYREGGAAYYEVIEGHPLLHGLRQLIDSADSLDERNDRWRPPLEETQRRNQERYRQQKRKRAERDTA
jgi:DNA-binding transcriptional ArsR family regulator